MYPNNSKQAFSEKMDFIFNLIVGIRFQSYDLFMDTSIFKHTQQSYGLNNGSLPRFDRIVPHENNLYSLSNNLECIPSSFQMFLSNLPSISISHT